jgi:hypothetical protein
MPDPNAAAELCEQGPLLMKPYEPKIVLEHIKRLLASRAAGQELTRHLPTYSRDAAALTAEQLSSTHNVLPQYEVGNCLYCQRRVGAR